ncbi:hypothetical protein ACO22_08108 [Paracoccidioides brasiliensis]|uniref:Retrovirus-related Pol polyprotein from transposon TNT 1-94-like beta-barrel domain-containing protein n=1 Tax=Paracoccidioides brasiliensis TaxID=121759 RepID=A0A1D2J358_PARBR|nr:hypothetical protein ACO22_08108 [Paracoccidioides brasiliensis]
MIYFSNKVMKNISVLDSESKAHIISQKNIVEVMLQRMNIMLKMADDSTEPVADVEKVCISTKKSSIELDNICYVLKLKINSMNLGKLGDIKTLKYTMTQWHQKLSQLNPVDITRMTADSRRKYE